MRAEGKYCVHCKTSEAEIRRQDRKVGRIPCKGKGTKKGRHSFGYSRVRENPIALCTSSKRKGLPQRTWDSLQGVKE